MQLYILRFILLCAEAHNMDNSNFQFPDDRQNITNSYNIIFRNELKQISIYQFIRVGVV